MSVQPIEQSAVVDFLNIYVNLTNEEVLFPCETQLHCDHLAIQVNERFDNKLTKLDSVIDLQDLLKLKLFFNFGVGLFTGLSQ